MRVAHDHQQTQKEDDEYERSRVDPVTAAANTADDNA